MSSPSPLPDTAGRLSRATFIVFFVLALLVAVALSVTLLNRYSFTPRLFQGHLSTAWIAVLTVMATAFWCGVVYLGLVRLRKEASRSLPQIVFTLGAELVILGVVVFLCVYNPYKVMERELTQAEISQLDGQLTEYAYGYLKAEIHNGTPYTVHRIVITLTIKGQGGEVKWSRKYELSSFNGAPNADSEYIARTNLQWQSGETVEWNIVGASTGY